MNIRRSCWGIPCLALVLTFAPTLFAEVASPDNAPITARPNGGGFRFGAAITGAPYSAIRTTTHVQTLANGSTITHTSVVKESRDSSGRTYTETTSEGGKFTSYRVFDPVNRVSISWNSKTKEAREFHLPDSAQFQRRGLAERAQPDGVQRPGPQFAGGFRSQGGVQGRVHPEVANLGSKSISGVYADGTRTTRTTPAGKVGNSEPLVSTHESWLSPDLKIELQRIDTDPREGTTTMALSNIVRGEPDVNLFRVPDGYTVKEEAGRGFRP
jgi:hypothetical protein